MTDPEHDNRDAQQQQQQQRQHYLHPEQQGLLSSRGSVSLDDQVVYDSVDILFLDEIDDDDDDDDDDKNKNKNNKSENGINNDDDDDDAGDTSSDESKQLTIWEIICILSTAFSYGCILTTLFLITLPVECERIESQHLGWAKSVALGNFVAIAGVTQLISPIVGRLSDTFQPPPPHDLGQRLPFLVLGSVLTVFGLLGQMMASYRSFWLRYSFAFFAHMIGLNIMYAMMLAIIPDQVPHKQTGLANGILAGLLVTGSLFGFGLFHGFLRDNIQDMYGLYTCIVICSTILTGLYGHDRDVDTALVRMNIRRLSASFSNNHNDGQNQNKHHHHHHDDDDHHHHDRENSTRRQRMLRKFKKRLRKVRSRANRVTQTVVVTPTVILRCMLVDTFQDMNCQSFWQSYTIDMEKHHDFFWVTVSRLFYYCGMSVQTFFMYFLKDIIQLKNDPEGATATLSIIGQIAGACTCLPVGIASDRFFHGKRKPFVYLACFLLATTTFTTIFARTMHDMVIVMIVLGGANGIYLTMDTSLAVDTLPKDFDETNGSAQLLGIWGVAAFLGSALGPMIGGPVLYYVGSQPTANITDAVLNYDDDITEHDSKQGYSIKGYAVLLSLSSLYFFLSSLSLNFVRDSR